MSKKKLKHLDDELLLECAKNNFREGIKEGEQNIKDRIGNILSDENVYFTDEDKIGKIWFIIEEQKIKGDEK